MLCIFKTARSFVHNRRYIRSVDLSIGSNTYIEVNIQNTTCACGTGVDVSVNGNNNRVSLFLKELKLKGFNEGTGVGVKLSHRGNNNNTVVIHIENCTIATNEGLRLEFSRSIETVNITIINTLFTGNLFGLYILKIGKTITTRIRSVILIKIIGTSFEHCRLALYLAIPFDGCDTELNIKNSTFMKNKGGLQVVKYNNNFYLQNFISYIRIYLVESVFVLNGGEQSCTSSGGAIKLTSVNKITFKNCTIAKNNNSALTAFLTSIYINGTSLFTHNEGFWGGAMNLWHSHLYNEHNSTLILSNNHAYDTGGGIYAENNIPANIIETVLTDHCFHQFYDRQVEVHFFNNTAENGGDDVFGGRIQTECKRVRHTTRRNYLAFYHFHNTSLSSVSSEPKRVCLCNNDGVPQCANLDYIYATIGPYYPGEVFSVSLVLVGNDFGATKGVVYAKLLSKDTASSLGSNQRLHNIRKHRECSQISLSVQSLRIDLTHTVQLSSRHESITSKQTDIIKAISFFETQNTIQQLLLRQPVSLDITLKDCPVGMLLSDSTPYVCKCHSRLEMAGITHCFISNHIGRIFRSKTVWLSAFENVSNTSYTTDFVVHKYCPLNYCNPMNISIDPRFPEDQCALNRSGVLCGQCQEGLSLVLGSSKCMVCDNVNMLLLLLFIVSGIVLVVFLVLLDLTVAKGTLNGLIFYANILWASKSIYMKDQDKAQILHTFLAWINLDFGIEACFIDGLNAYWKTWLQFAFPVYIWTLIGLIIVSSHYSTRASKIFGNNSVPVLATMILLSYSKLLRTIIDSLSFSILVYANNSAIVWTMDGNYHFFGTAHAILLLVSMTVLLLLWMPFTLILLTLQWLRKKSNKKPLRWINRLKPFFDAYFGQLKPKHHYWIGLLLLMRAVLLTVYASTAAITPSVNIALMVTTSILLLLMQVYTGPVYKTLLYRSLKTHSY